MPLVAAACCALGFGPPSLTESDSEQLPIRRTQVQQLAAGVPPTVAAQAALIMDLETGRPVLERNARAQLAPASITKVMTAVVVLERANLDDRTTALAEDLVEGSSMGLLAGDTVTVEQLLWGLMLPSGNDAAQVLARHVGGGSVDAFVRMMNEKAAALQLSNTRFANAHGLDQAGHYSTAYELAVLSRYAATKPLFAKMAATKEFLITLNRPLLLRNTNQLLFASDVPGVNGIKTGFTDRAGDSLVASANRDGKRVLVVVLGTQNRSSTAATLIEFAYRFYSWVPLPPSGDLLSDGGKGTQHRVMVPGWQRPYTRYTLERFRPSLGTSAGIPQALLRVQVGSDELAQQALYANQ